MSEIPLQKEEPAPSCTQFAMKARHANGLIKAEITAFSVLYKQKDPKNPL